MSALVLCPFWFSVYLHGKAGNSQKCLTHQNSLRSFKVSSQKSTVLTLEAKLPFPALDTIWIFDFVRSFIWIKVVRVQT